MKSTLLKTLLLLSPLASFALEAPDSGDSFTSASALLRTKNFGAATSLNVKAGQNGYLKFDLGVLPAGTTGSQVAKATLRLWVSRVMAPGSLNVAIPAAGWNEYTVRGLNAPGLPTVEVPGVALPLAATSSFLSIDVTGLVQDWVDGTLANTGIGLAPAGGSALNAYFDSKENSHQPVIDITLVTAPGPKGDKGDTGATGPHGPAGPVGTLMPKGAWNGTTSYITGDIVSYVGSTWMAVRNGSNSQPAVGNANWMPLTLTAPAPSGSLMASSSLTPPTGYAATGLAVANWSPIPGLQDQYLLVLGVINGKAYGYSSAPPYDLPSTPFLASYDPVQNTYVKSKAAPPDNTNFQASAVANGRIYFLGGSTTTSDQNGSPYYSPPQMTYVYDPVTDAWSQRASSPSSGYLRVAAAVNGKIYGWSESSTQIEVFDPSSNNWSTANSKPLPPNNYNPQTWVAATNGKIYAFPTGSTIQEYDPVADTWTSKVTAADLITPTTATSDGYLWAEGSRYDPSSDSIQKESLAPFGDFSNAFEINGTLYFLGTIQGSKAPLSSFQQVYIKQ